MQTKRKKTEGGDVLFGNSSTNNEIVPLRVSSRQDKEKE
jgi:hypothetical protein